jgi:hypothetical protein
VDNDDPLAYLRINSNWALADCFSVRQAAALVAGFDPGSLDSDDSRFVNPESGEHSFVRIADYRTVLATLRQAVMARALPAVIRRSSWERGWNEEPGEGEKLTKDVEIEEGDTDDWGAVSVSVRRRGLIYRVAPDWDLTMVTRADLTAWLAHRGQRTGFFFLPAAPAAQTTGVPAYLDSAHPRFAPKLAAAIRAWEAVTHPNGKSPKQEIALWLREHAAELGLVENGKPKKSAIDEIAAICNWQPDGGAPKTPGP